MIAHAHAYLRGHWLRHTERKNLLMNLLGLLTAVEFFENVMFIFGAAHIMGGVDAAPEEFVHAQAAYAVGSLMAMVLQQRLARRFGYRRYLACAMLLFVLGLLGCARSANISQMVVARLVQGAGGGAFFTSSRVLVTLLFAPADRPRALKRFMLLIFGGSALAPVCAAWLIESWGWAWVFYGVLPAALLAGAGVLLLPDGAGRMARAQPLHMAAMPLAWFALAVVCLQVAVSQARLDVLAHPARLVLVGAAGVLLLAGFLWWQWRHPEPLLHLRMLHNPVYLMGLGLYFVHYFLSNFSAYLFPIYAERGLGLPLAATGWLNSLAALASLCVAWTYIRFFARRLVHKRPVMLVGLSCMALCAW
ncbi:MAG TPA: MFS transporter, partial [Burkholderiaceae bacterium]